jgi:hypothetical protein
MARTASGFQPNGAIPQAGSRNPFAGMQQEPLHKPEPEGEAAEYFRMWGQDLGHMPAQPGAAGSIAQQGALPTDERLRASEAQIAQVHPGFLDTVDNDPKFHEFVYSGPPDRQHRAYDAVINRKPAELIQLLSDYKATQQRAFTPMQHNWAGPHQPAFQPFQPFGHQGPVWGGHHAHTPGDNVAHNAMHLSAGQLGSAVGVSDQMTNQLASAANTQNMTALIAAQIKMITKMVETIASAIKAIGESVNKVYG